MATVRKTITLTDKQDSWIKAQIDAGHYTNDSEYIRDLIQPGYRRRSIERHMIYFRITAYGIAIVRTCTTAWMRRAISSLTVSSGGAIDSANGLACLHGECI